MFNNLFGKKPQHPLADLFADTTTTQKNSILNLMLVIAICDSENDQPKSGEMSLLNSYVEIFNVRADNTMQQLQRSGIGGIVNDLKNLSLNQKEMLVTMVHGMICIDGKPNEIEIESALKFFNAIGIDEDKYIEVVSKANAISNTFLK